MLFCLVTSTAATPPRERVPRLGGVAVLACLSVLLGAHDAHPSGAATGPDARVSSAAAWKPVLCTLPSGATTLPASARRGLIDHLDQYPAVALATAGERARARALLWRIRSVAARWPSARAAAAAGFETRTAKRDPGDRLAHYLHAERRRERRSGGAFDVRHPKALIFANEPGRELKLIGVMYSMKRGHQGPSPGGPITRWHRHQVCMAGLERGLEPRRDGSCPPGARLTQGSEMMHVWFTRDLRSAFAIRAPEVELCRDGLLVGSTCENPGSARGM